MLRSGPRRCRSIFPRETFRLAFPAALLLLLPLMVAGQGCSVSPRPFTGEQFLAQGREARAGMFENQEPLGETVTLYEAMARAVKYNLEHRLKLLEKAMATGNLEQARYDMLPQLVASAGYSRRGNESGSASKSLLSGVQSLEPSTSEERDRFTAEVVEVWNILDFGLGYTRAQQMADELLVSEEMRRKAVQNILQDVRYAFWRAACAELLLPHMDELLHRVESALDRSRRMEEARAEAPIKVLSYQQELLETLKQLWAMRRELAMAKTELSALMNLEPGTEYRLEPETAGLQPSAYFLALDALEEQALSHRPELRIEAYRKRISRLEVRSALLGMLPGLDLSVGSHYDANKYLYNNSWLQTGANLSWNFLRLFAGPAAVKTARFGEDLAAERYLAMAMMVLTQVHLAHQGYELTRMEYRIAEDLDAVHRRKLGHVEAARKAQTGSELEEIRLQAAALSAAMNKGLAYAKLQGALGRIFHSAGRDPMPATVPTHEVAGLAGAIERHEQNILAALREEAEGRAGQAPPEEASAPLFADRQESRAVDSQADIEEPLAGSVTGEGRPQAVAAAEFVGNGAMREIPGAEDANGFSAAAGQKEETAPAGAEDGGGGRDGETASGVASLPAEAERLAKAADSSDPPQMSPVPIRIGTGSYGGVPVESAPLRLGLIYRTPEDAPARN